jgi:hypothetical protein
MMAMTFFNAVINRARGQRRGIEGGGKIEATEVVIEATEVEATEVVIEVEATEVVIEAIEAANLGMTEGVAIEGVLSSWSFSDAGD